MLNALIGIKSEFLSSFSLDLCISQQKMGFLKVFLLAYIIWPNNAFHYDTFTGAHKICLSL